MRLLVLLQVTGAIRAQLLPQRALASFSSRYFLRALWSFSQAVPNSMLPCLICFIAGHARKYVDEEEVYHGTWKERGTKLPEALILEAAFEQQRIHKPFSTWRKSMPSCRSGKRISWRSLNSSFSWAAVKKILVRSMWSEPLCPTRSWGRSIFARPAAVLDRMFTAMLTTHFSTLKPNDTSDGEQYLLSYGQRLVELGLSFGTLIGAWALLQSISDRNAARRKEDRYGLWQEACPEV